MVKKATKRVCLHVSFQLARRGLDVVLVSRSDEKLHTVAKEIGESSENNSGVPSKHVCLSMCDSRAEMIQNILCLLQRISMDERLAPSKRTSQTATVSTLL